MKKPPTIIRAKPQSKPSEAVETRTSEEVDEVTRSPAPGFESLYRVLMEAHDQAAFGKGAERHGHGLPYNAQPMQGISFLLGSSEGLLWQVIKKTQEAQTKLAMARGCPDKEVKQIALQFARRELLGAINYLAGALIYEEAHL